MRIISGEYKGRKLRSSADLSIRPTTDKVKEFIFNILQDFPRNRLVVDFFAGSGNLGLEALSRGARQVVFVEKSYKSIDVLNQNISSLNLKSEQYRVVHQDALQFAQTNCEIFDLYLMDPPFDYPPLQKLICTVISKGHFNSNHLIAVEHEITNPLLMDHDYYTVIKQKKMGRSLISFITKKVKNESE